MDIHVKLDLSGLDTTHAEVYRRLPDLLDAISEDLIAQWQQSFDESPASGRTYQRGKKTHTASSPGNPPVVDTGELRASLHYKKRGRKARDFYGAEYGLYLNDSAILDRPWIEPGINEVVENKVPGIMKAIIEG